MAMVLTAAYKLFRYFKEGQQSLKDVLQKGRALTAAHNVGTIACIQEVICENCRQMNDKATKTVNVSHDICHSA